jgi:hypothetical protein
MLPNSYGEDILLSPLKQLKSGINPDYIQCKTNYILVFKSEDDSPACVTQETSSKLIERGWEKHLIVPEAATGTSITQNSNQTFLKTQIPTPCDTPYYAKPYYSSPISANGTMVHVDYTPVLYLPTNAIGKICIHFNNYGLSRPPTMQITCSKNCGNNANITTTANPDHIPSAESTVVYTIKTGNVSGFYGISIFCGGGIPFAVGYNNQSKIVKEDFPWLGEVFSCPSMAFSFNVIGISGMGIYQMKTMSNIQSEYYIPSTNVTSVHPTSTTQNVTFSVPIRTFAKPVNFQFDYDLSTIFNYAANPFFTQLNDVCHWLPYAGNGNNFLTYQHGEIEVTARPVTIPSWSNNTYTFSILIKNLPSGFYALRTVIDGKPVDRYTNQAYNTYLAFDYPITIGVGSRIDPTGICYFR